MGSELNDIFHSYAHLEVVSKSFVGSLAFSLFLTTEEREVSSANNLALDFNPSGTSLTYIKKRRDPKMYELEELPQVQVASLNTEHLEELYEIYRQNNA